MNMANILAYNELEQNEYHNQQSTINNQQSTMYAYGTRQSTEFYWSFPFHQPIILK